ncbi:sugar ABC transporter substrate-binding protein [Alkalihalobacillus alcalophilus ATCC 27647 = CGMCC 1.3604]|uniref:Sugar ABC transporter substrate-binding protein n=1 Tax=Alkalihalobacillus alcalophilus ATCC 27647 = CGMCC 1.3604 TaxID=1218173 RepID=A0A094WLU9_ALKAL|nr:ABC transporter substrate-binding protein [Alkalihalobacillus alcalophilus]KGA97806.1 sugar ABC transporter substrate-binding protein [Alkalihalobacillus alcalophilus ATCC 27647 = CGMCC 1.3604]MED1563791.1 ABC transporter substrate-binding protein [Alkalihalobacillus alcalophilus]THG89718.1 sugar ABC transporter substrate-binding protein [Alkalihalobacillus alcalophilus ATCC 27647 = CGMCC 1.3604]
MSKMKHFKGWMLATAAAVALTMTGCGGAEEEEAVPEVGTDGELTVTDPADVSGDLTVLVHRTDIVDTVFQDYAAEFQETYPNVNLSFEAITDYQGQVNIRMNTKDYGDVLMIPDNVPVEDLPHFFEPLGATEEMLENYLFTDDMAYQGVTYGIPITINANGILYNKDVFEEAGVTDVPATPEEFMEALSAINENTDAIPLYTNYGAGWPLNQWEPNRVSIAGNPDFTNELIHTDAPFAEGEPHHILYKVMYDAADQGLIEGDPLTTDWESSKQMMADGKIATMVLGSWAITQVQELAEDPESIGYMPFPYTQEDGTIYSAVAADFNIGINVNSDHKEAARAWVDFFINDSNYAVDQGGISPVVGEDYPSTLASFEELGVEFISENPHREGEEGFLDQIDNESEVGLWIEGFKQRMIEAGIGNRAETYEDITNDLNSRWEAGRTRVVE